MGTLAHVPGVTGDTGFNTGCFVPAISLGACRPSGTSAFCHSFVLPCATVAESCRAPKESDKLMLEQAGKLRFMREQLQAPDPFSQRDEVHGDVVHAIGWMSSRTPTQMRLEREHIMSQIERTNNILRADGACKQWFDSCDPGVVQVSREANGKLFELLLKSTNHPDKGAADVLRYGAELIGDIPVTGNGTPCVPVEGRHVDSLCVKRRSRNEWVLGRLKPDKNAAWLLEQALEDCKVGRMQQHDLKCVCVHESKLTGVKDDGSIKLRAIDDLSVSYVNICTCTREKLHCDTLDKLAAILQAMAARRWFGVIQGGRRFSLSQSA
eukprot:12149461-Karenia_brevis.AAC.1